MDSSDDGTPGEENPFSFFASTRTKGTRPTTTTQGGRTTATTTTTTTTQPAGTTRLPPVTTDLPPVNPGAVSRADTESILPPIVPLPTPLPAVQPVQSAQPGVPPLPAVQDVGGAGERESAKDALIAALEEENDTLRAQVRSLKAKLRAARGEGDVARRQARQAVQAAEATSAVLLRVAKAGQDAMAVLRDGVGDVRLAAASLAALGTVEFAE